MDVLNSTPVAAVDPFEVSHDTAFSRASGVIQTNDFEYAERQRGQVSLLTVSLGVDRLYRHFLGNLRCQDHHGLTKPEDCTTL